MSGIGTARAIAETAHAGQVDKAGKPYIEHPRAVVKQVEMYGYEPLTIAAWLHDVIEDSEWTAERLLAGGIPAEAIRLVEAVSRREGESYLEEFIPRVIAGGLWAIRLKLADLWHNTHPSRRASLRPSLHERYVKAEAMLLEALVEA